MAPVQTQIFNEIETISSGNRISSEFAPALIKPIVREPIKQLQGQKATLNSIFPTQQEENKLTKARRILGDITSDIPDDELEVYLTKFEFLLDTWLDKFEKQIFNNKTLNQLLREG